jgi:Transcriptional Coactivator p15 (PC4)
MSEPVIIAQWELNSRESLRVEIHEYRGTQLIGIRKWFAAENGVMAPGKHGINLSLKHLPRLAAAVNDALSKAREDGLITSDSGCDQR